MNDDLVTSRGLQRFEHAVLKIVCKCIFIECGVVSTISKRSLVSFKHVSFHGVFFPPLILALASFYDFCNTTYNYNCSYRGQVQLTVAKGHRLLGLSIVVDCTGHYVQLINVHHMLYKST